MAFLDSLLDGLFQASFRGVEFHIPDAREEVGQRVQRDFFPGRDDTTHQFLGAYDGPIGITGLIVGADYVARAEALRAAFRQPGPGTLLHPWFGELQVVLAKPARMSFTEREVRVCRIEAEFEPWSERAPQQLDTLGRLLAAISALRARVRAFLREVLAPVRLAFAVLAQVQSFVASAVAGWNAAVLTVRGAGGILPALAAPFATLRGAGALTGGLGYGDGVATALSVVPSSIASAAVPLQAPAIGPGGTAQPNPAIAAADAAALLLAGADRQPGDAAGIGPALALAARAFAVADACGAASDIDYESQPEARAWAARLDAALRATAALAEAQATDWPMAAGALWRDLAGLRAAVAADMSVRIGRLPAVVTLLPPAPAPVWLLAQHVAGDAPARLEAVYLDLVRRNRLRHPGLAPAAPLEMLA